MRILIEDAFLPPSSRSTSSLFSKFSDRGVSQTFGSGNPVPRDCGGPLLDEYLSYLSYKLLFYYYIAGTLSTL